MKTGAGGLEKEPPNFEEIYRENAPRVLNLCYRMVGNEQTARDLAQDVWVKALRNLSEFKGHSSVSTWLYRITVNHIFNYYKQQKRRRWREILNLDLREGLREEAPLPGDFADDREPDPLDILQDKERNRIVWQMIQRLPAAQRVPLILFRYEGLSYQEISEVMGISTNAVESRLHRAKRNLRKWLEPYITKI